MSDDEVKEGGKVEMKVKRSEMADAMRRWYLKRVCLEEKKKGTC